MSCLQILKQKNVLVRHEATFGFILFIQLFMDKLRENVYVSECNQYKSFNLFYITPNITGMKIYTRIMFKLDLMSLGDRNRSEIHKELRIIINSNAHCESSGCYIKKFYNKL